MSKIDLSASLFGDGKKSHKVLKNITLHDVLNFIDKIQVSDEIKEKLKFKAKNYPQGSLLYFVDNIRHQIDIAITEK